MASRALKLGLRGFQIFCALIVVALVGAMVAATPGADPAIVNFDLFVGVFAMLSLIYLTLATWNPNFEFHPAIMLLLDALNVLWWFCGAVATAAILGVHSCSIADYTKNNQITRGGPDQGKRCREAQASTAFLFFGLFAFAANLVLTFLDSRGRVNLRGAGSSPSMTQV